MMMAQVGLMLVPSSLYGILLAWRAVVELGSLSVVVLLLGRRP